MADDNSEPRFGWCFDHGTMHNPPGWCTANWVPLTGDTMEEAAADKTQRFGDAEFIFELPLEQQMDVMRAARRP